jgi:hypothetical protein
VSLLKFSLVEHKISCKDFKFYVFCVFTFALKLLVPLVLLQHLLLELTRRGQEPLRMLLQFGVMYLEEHAAEFIIQQGGWVWLLQSFL